MNEKVYGISPEMLKNVTRNVSTVGLEVRDFSPGTVANRADTYTQTHTHDRIVRPVHSLFLRPIATVCPDVLVSLRNLIRGLVCVLFVEIICEGACFSHAMFPYVT